MDDKIKKNSNELAAAPTDDQNYEDLLRAVAEIILVLEQKIGTTAKQKPKWVQ